MSQLEQPRQVDPMLVAQSRLGLVRALARHACGHSLGHVRRLRFDRAHVGRKRQLREEQRQNHKDNSLAAEEVATGEHGGRSVPTIAIRRSLARSARAEP